MSDLEDITGYMKPFKVIMVERDGKVMRYKRMDTGKIVPHQAVEILQEKPGLTAYDGKSKTDIMCLVENPYIENNANAIVLGERTKQNIYAYSFAKARL